MPAPSKSALVGLGVTVVAGGLLLPRLFLSPTEPASPETPSLLLPLLKMAVGLIVVSAAVVAVARYANKRTPVAPMPSLTLAASLTVGGRAVVHLVEANGRRLLVGVDLGGVKALAELPPRPTVVGPRTAEVPTGFADELAAVLAQRQPFTQPPRPPAIENRLPGR